jgi:hypothetical protein
MTTTDRKRLRSKEKRKEKMWTTKNSRRGKRGSSLLGGRARGRSIIGEGRGGVQRKMPKLVLFFEIPRFNKK